MLFDRAQGGGGFFFFGGAAAFFAGANAVEIERVRADGKAAFAGDGFLAVFDFRVAEFFYLAADQTDEVVVMLPLIEFKDGLAAFKIVPFQNAGLLKLGEHAIDGGKTNVHALIEQVAVDVFGGEMALLRVLEEVKDFQARIGGFQPGVFQVPAVLGHKTAPVEGEEPYDILKNLFIAPAEGGVQDGFCGGIQAMRQTWMAALMLALALGGCAIVQPYRADLRQGNYIDEVAVDEVKPGMTRDQVRYLLGTPLVVDTFRPDRWDYVYEFISGRERKPELRKVTVFFEQDVVARVERGEGGAQLTEEEQALRAKNRVIEVPEPAKK